MQDLQLICEQLPPAAHVLIWGLVLLWEYGVGKTRFGSTIGLLVVSPITKALKWLKLDQEESRWN